MSIRQCGLVVEAAIFLCAAWFLVNFVGFSRYSRWLQSDIRENSGRPDSQTSVATVKMVAASIRIAERNIPWDIVCLPQAIAAKWMLMRRKVVSQLSLGVGNSSNEADFRAHAWLEAGGIVVTGYSGREGLETLARFS